MTSNTVTQPIPGTWLVHGRDQPPTSGTAVWLYSAGWKCEKHGSIIGTTRTDCEDIKIVKDWRKRK